MRPTPWRIDPLDVDDGPVLAGIDIGGTTTQAILVDSDLRILARSEAPTPALESGVAMAATAASLVRGLAGERSVLGVGVGAAGVVDTTEGRILVASDSFAGWSGFPLAAVLSEALGAPTFVDNDVNAFLRGEISTGAIQGARDALGITLGTGVGGAIWIDGQLFDGPRGGAGEIGHIPGFGDAPCTCGGRGHLETWASGRSISRRWAGISGYAPVSAQVVGERAAAGDEHALQVFSNAAEAVGQAILMVAGLLDVTTVVIGGGVSRSWALLGGLIRSELDRNPPVSGTAVRLEVSALAADAVVLGAAARASTELFEGESIR